MRNRKTTVKLGRKPAHRDALLASLVGSLIQHGRASDTGDTALVAMVTHEGPERCVARALELLDGRERHSNGWFVVRSAVPAGATREAVEWRVAPSALPGFRAAPVVQVSQVAQSQMARDLRIVSFWPA